MVLSGHDHHRVDEVVDGTRLLKPGLDAIYATVLTMEWADAQQAGADDRGEFVPLAEFEADAAMAAAATARTKCSRRSAIRISPCAPALPAAFFIIKQPRSRVLHGPARMYFNSQRGQHRPLARRRTRRRMYNARAATSAAATTIARVFLLFGDLGGRR